MYIYALKLRQVLPSKLDISWDYHFATRIEQQRDTEGSSPVTPWHTRLVPNRQNANPDTQHDACLLSLAALGEFWGQGVLHPIGALMTDEDREGWYLCMDGPSSAELQEEVLEECQTPETQLAERRAARKEVGSLAPAEALDVLCELVYLAQRCLELASAYAATDLPPCPFEHDTAKDAWERESTGCGNPVEVQWRVKQMVESVRTAWLREADAQFDPEEDLCPYEHMLREHRASLSACPFCNWPPDDEAVDPEHLLAHIEIELQYFAKLEVPWASPDRKKDRAVKKWYCRRYPKKAASSHHYALEEPRIQRHHAEVISDYDTLV
ncbi:uncharacterized protein BO97DRAFT_423542 [Aspergillus homomorphus CBS 101889]|uniref:Uncharacterized protein n=1 Tax=Aspergillus homomorphus (strain CBS 101889) TaxID=1450537 RepID=A0A395HZH5_ASPHC|nr:hypothetical protein BO97DRAFT_423542 [Aspergillus homomorphus CBS 101889]RAL13331.1 hypothetical protein BO97DRAFT_423542 [Aspergillus homomorphus CBS 101889]